MRNASTLLIALFFCCNAIAQNNLKWATNLSLEVGTDGYSGIYGVQTTGSGLDFTVKDKYAVTGGLAFELVNLHQRPSSTWGKTAPAFGLKTRVEWEFNYADNSDNGDGGNMGLNYVSVPLLFEVCLGYRKGVTVASRTSGTDTYTSHVDAFNNVVTEHQYTPGTYNPGGAPVSNAAFFYIGPQYSYLFKSFHNNAPITDPNFIKTYAAVVGGFNFWLHGISFDISYQKGLTSIYKGKDIRINGYLLRIGFWLASTKKRRY